MVFVTESEIIGYGTMRSERNFEGNLFSSYVVNVLLPGITILGRKDRII